MCRLIRHFWDEATNVCRASGNYGVPFKAGRGVTQGGPLLAKLFKVLVDAVAREWLRLLREEMVMEEEELDKMMATLFAIFYVDDMYIASRDPVFLQRAINGLVSTFERVDLETNIKKTQVMTCTPGTICLQLPTKSYLRMRTGRTPAAQWDACTVTCRECRKDMRASFLAATLQINMRSIRCNWWPRSYSAGGRVWSTRYCCVAGNLNACSPCARGS